MENKRLGRTGVVGLLLDEAARRGSSRDGQDGGDQTGELHVC